MCQESTEMKKKSEGVRKKKETPRKLFVCPMRKCLIIKLHITVSCDSFLKIFFGLNALYFNKHFCIINTTIHRELHAHTNEDFNIKICRKI